MRAAWKIPYINLKYLKNSFFKQKILKIKYKNSIIGQNFKNRNILLYNGKEYLKVDINSQKIGYKFGEFILTKCSYFYRHLKKSKKKSKK